MGADDEIADLEDICDSLGIDSRTRLARTAPDEERTATTAELLAAARRFYRKLRRALNESIEELGISYAQFEILQALDADPNLHGAAIAHDLGSTRQAVSALLETLIATGFVDTLPVDRGVVGLRITHEGVTLLSRCTSALQGLHLLLERLSPHERHTLALGLNHATTALTPFPGWD